MGGSKKTTRQEIDRYLEPRYLSLDAMLDDIEQEIVFAQGLFGGGGLALRPCAPAGRKLALAISGGGAGGVYSAGALEAILPRLRERGIDIDILVGTSSGAVNGYGVFLESLGKTNPQLDEDPAMKQPFRSYIASVWSYLDRGGKASRWVVGRRSWLIKLVSKGIGSGKKRLALGVGFLLPALLVNSYLFLLPFLTSGLDGTAFPSAQDPGFPLEYALRFFLPGLVAPAVLAVLALVLFRGFGGSLFRDTPLLRLLANTGPNGDLTAPRFWPREQTVDRARVLSREIAAAWYAGRGKLPEFIVTATDISAGRECLFTLVRPETYSRLIEREWMAVQFDSDTDGAKEYRKHANALFALPESLLKAVAASSAVPGAFPTQNIGIYGASSRRYVRHCFVDGGVLDNSPIHIAIDAGATHVISLEMHPLERRGPMDSDERGKAEYGLFQAALKTFTAVLDRATTEDIRRTVAWNRFLARRPESLGQGKPPAGESGKTQSEQAAAAMGRRIVPLYRIAPRSVQIGTVEFDGRYSGGKRTVTLRDLLRRGVVDMQGENIWRATTRHVPGGDAGGGRRQ